MKNNSVVGVLLIGVILFTGCRPEPKVQYIKAYENNSLTLKASRKISLGCQWYKDGSPLPGETERTVKISNFSKNDEGLYTSTFRGRKGIDSFYVESYEIGLDTNDIPYHNNQFIIQLDSNLSLTERETIRKKFNVNVLDTCMCNLELWKFDSLALSPNEKGEKLDEDPELQGADPNYVLYHDTEVENNPTSINIPDKKNSSPKVLVAIIDSGIDSNHDEFTGKIWKNPKEFNLTLNMDDDGNCLKDDVNGYDFVNMDNNPDDEFGHGTHVAGLVNRFSQGHAQILPLKAFGKQPTTSLFNVICATHYAVSKGATIINCSFGWYKTPSRLYERLIDSAGQNCGVLFVCSAGNDGSNNDSRPHFPSSYDLNNVLEITSIDSSSFIGNSGSNVDLDLEGRLRSSTPNGSYAIKEGTSMSAAAVSGIAAYVYANNSNAKWSDVKTCLEVNSNLPSSLTSQVIREGSLTDLNLITPNGTCISNSTSCPPVAPSQILPPTLNEL